MHHSPLLLFKLAYRTEARDIFLDIYPYLSFSYLFLYRHNCHKRRYHCRAIVFLHPFCQLYKLAFYTYGILRYTLYIFDFVYIIVRLISEAYYISGSYSISFSKRNLHNRANHQLINQFLRNSISERFVNISLRNIYYYIRIFY